MTVPRLLALHEEWQRHPPLPLMAAAFLGIRPKAKGTAEELLNRIIQMQTRE